jgi:hypothetical protein
VKYAVMNHFVSLVMAVVSVIALAIFYRRAAVFFAGLIVTGILGVLKLPVPGYNNTWCFKKCLTTLKAYKNLFIGHAQYFELS